MSTFWSSLQTLSRPVFSPIVGSQVNWMRSPSISSIPGLGFGQGGFGQGGFGGAPTQSGVAMPLWLPLLPLPVYASVSLIDNTGSQWSVTIDVFGRLGTQISSPVLPTLSKTILTMIDVEGFLWDVLVSPQGRIGVLSSSSDYSNVMSNFVLIDSSGRNWTIFMGVGGNLGSQ